MHQAMATVIVAVGLAVAGWGINILLSDNSPFLPWVSPSLISGGLGLVLAGVVRLARGHGQHAYLFGRDVAARVRRSVEGVGPRLHRGHADPAQRRGLVGA